MKRTWHTLVLLSCLSLFATSGCAPSAAIKARALDSLAGLRHRLDAILADSVLARSTAGVKIVSLKTGETLYDRNSDLLFHPASNEKLLTSATALSLLGPTFSFKTVAACDSVALQNGILAGDLYLIGRGNPDLTTNDLYGMARQLADKGIRQVNGNLVCDDYYFDEVWWGKGWMWDDDPSTGSSRISALTLDDNAVTVTVSPADRVGRPALARLKPNAPHLLLVNTSVTVERKSQIDSLELPRLSIDRRWRQNQNTFVVDGAIGADEEPRTVRMNVLHPELLAGHVFRALLEQLGIRVEGVVQRGLSPSRSRVLAEHRQPLLPVLLNLNKISDNLSAELLLKTIGAERYGWPGTAKKGVRAVREFLGRIEVDTLALKIADGSGISRMNLITPAAIVDLLTAMWKNLRVRNEFMATLPIAGMDGTLRRRMRGTAAEGVLRAKTGTLIGVSALSGYTATAGGEEIAFSMMMQHYLGSSSAVRKVQDRIGEAITAFRRSITAPATTEAR